MTYWTRHKDGTFVSEDDTLIIEVEDDGTVFVTDSSGEYMADSGEYEDEEDGLNPNVVTNDFPSIEAMLDYYEVPADGLELLL